MSWHVSRNGKIRGPFSESEMFELIGKRKVTAGDMVDANQAGNWWPVESVPTFAESFMAGQAPIVQQVPVYYAAPPMPTPMYVPDSVCVRCGAQGRKLMKSRVTGTGWIVFWIFLFLCFPIALVALVAMREQYSYCQSCGSQG